MSAPVTRILLNRAGRYEAYVLSLVGDNPMSGKWMQIAVRNTRDEARAELDAFVARIRSHDP